MISCRFARMQLTDPVTLYFTFLALLGGISTGCGTTRYTDTTRTAMEQLLISDAIDQAVESLDLSLLEDQTVFLDESKIGAAVVDRDYLISSIRQHLLASGCVLKTNRDDADFVLEARTGVLGTDRNDLLFGIPATNVPQVVPLQGVPAALPEIPFAKRSVQRAVAKLAVFAYHRESGEPVWQSGLAMSESSSHGIWVLGAGPFQKGSIYSGTNFAGQGLKSDKDKEHRYGRLTRIGEAAVFASPHKLVKRDAPETEQVAGTGPSESAQEGVQGAAYSEVAAPAVVNQAYAELPIEPVAKRPSRPPAPDAKARAVPQPANGVPGAAGM